MNMNLIMIQSSVFNLYTIKKISKYLYTTIAKNGVLDEFEVEDKPSYSIEPKYDKGLLDKIRNKSQLNQSHENILNNKKPYKESMEWYHDTVWYRKKLMGRYGIEGACVTPAIAWPSQKEVEDIKEYEQTLYPISLEEILAQIKEAKNVEIIKIKQREKDIDKEVAQFDKWRAILKGKLEKKLLAKYEMRNKKRVLIQEVQEKFGYAIKLRDAKAKEYLDNKLELDKIKKKKEKRKIKDERLLAYVKKEEENLEK